MAGDGRPLRTPLPRHDGYTMRAYSKMLYLRELISKEKATQYYGKCMELARARGDLAEIYSTSARYYQYMRNTSGPWPISTRP